MLILQKNIFVRLQGGAIILVTNVSTNNQIFSGYNVSSTSMKFKDYETYKGKELVYRNDGILIIKNTVYDKNAENRVKEVLSILKLRIKPQIRPAYKKAKNKYHYPKKYFKNSKNSSKLVVH